MYKKQNPLLFLLLILLSACIPKADISSRFEKEPIPVKVLLKSAQGKESIAFNGTFLLKSEEAVYEFGRSNNSIFVSPEKKGFKVFNQKRLFRFRKADTILFTPKNPANSFEHEGKKYAGTLTIYFSEGRIHFVNTVGMEKYLNGVVPAEIFTNNPAIIEAVKAQAICARTYALKKVESRKKKSFHLYDDVRDQAYKGVGIETKIGSKAVKLTRGSVLMYNNAYAQTYFHASCGGISEDAADVWGTQYPYLTRKQDVIGKEFADSKSPYYRWLKVRTISQLDSIYQHTFGKSVLKNTVQDTTFTPFTLHVLKRSESGRVLSMKVKYGNQEHILKEGAIRRFLGWPIGTLLPSTLFQIMAEKDSIKIEGAGNGHGVGLCQYGAMFKAEKGLKYYHILQSYYPETTLKKVY